MASDDPAALAASTAQGWAYALNATARPAPEHIQAAQEALSALGRVDTANSWVLDRLDLDRALTAARLRVGGGQPEVTVAQLTEAVGQLRELGVIPDVAGPTVPQFVVDGALARGDRQRAELRARVAELEDQLEIETGELRAELDEANERAALTDAELRRQTVLRDRFEQERNAAQRNATLAHQRDMAAVERAREDSRRAGYVWCLAELGNSVPGYDDMSTEGLRDLAARRLREVNLDGGTLRHVANELVRIGRTLGKGYDGPPYFLSDKPLELVRVVAMLADWSQQARQAAVERQRELEDQLEGMRHQLEERQEGYTPDLAVVLAERDMLTRARDAQAAELRTLREERDDAERLIYELQEKLAELRRTAAEGAVRQEAGRRRIAELEAVKEAALMDDES